MLYYGVGRYINSIYYEGKNNMYNLLEKINSPDDLKKLKWNELEELCSQIRKFLVENVKKTGGHPASNLGVVELTVALHLVYDSPSDKFVWDVGHQSYVHKILTGRRDKFSTLRTFGGISGFPKTEESEYDSFNTGHSSTSASAAVGMARARDLNNEKYNIAAIFGDGAMTGGMIYEALNDIGHRKSPLVFILNDNQMSISQNVGGLSKYLVNLRQTHRYQFSKKFVKDILNKIPLIGKKAKNGLSALKDAIKLSVLPSTFFGDLGIEYLGPVDGHNLHDLVKVLTLAKNMNEPVLVHILTKKGKGYEPAEKNPENWHGISPASSVKDTSLKYADYSECAGKTLVSLARENKNFVAITAAMPSGVGLLDFMKEYPDRFFDVGIAEQHAVTFSAGLAISGVTPVFAVYSSFLQRSYDQILHDVCLQNLHVVFLLDRAGVVGADGETHHGLYDISFLSDMPYMTILSPSSFEELEQMLDYAINKHTGPVAIRYPRGNCSADVSSEFEINKINIYGDNTDNLIITTGRMLSTALKSQDILKNENINVSVIELPTIIPVSAELSDALKKAKTVMTLEDHSISGGLGSIISTVIAKNNFNVLFEACAFPDKPIIHGTVAQLDNYYNLSEKQIAERFKNLKGGQ